MSQSGKASIKKGKPSYFMSILGVTLVLFLLGIIGWLVINANKLGDYFKENVEVRAYLRGDLNPKDSLALIELYHGQALCKIISMYPRIRARNNICRKKVRTGARC
jgi:cell division transport system permease protein